MNRIVIRDMQTCDVPRVSEVLRACFAWLGQREGFDARQLAYLLGERSSEETVRREARTRRHVVACLGNDIVGMAVVNGAELARLYVDPRFHRRGVGRRLFAAAEEMVCANGFTEMRVGALVESAAAFYRSMGMHDVEQVAWEPEVFGDRQVTILTKRL